MKSDKELAIELMSNYLRAIYAQGKIKPLNDESLKSILTACYDAIKSLPDDT